MQRGGRRGGGRGAGKGGTGRVVGAFCILGTPAGHPPAAPPGHSFQSHRISFQRISAMFPPYCTSPSLPPPAQRPALIPSYLRRPLRPSPFHPIPIFILISSPSHPTPVPPSPRRSAICPRARLSTRHGPAGPVPPGAGAQRGATAPGPAALLFPAASPRPPGHRIQGR